MYFSFRFRPHRRSGQTPGASSLSAQAVLRRSHTPVLPIKSLVSPWPYPELSYEILQRYLGGNGGWVLFFELAADPCDDALGISLGGGVLDASKALFSSTAVIWVTLPKVVEKVAAAERSSVGQSDGLSVNIRWRW